MGDLFSRRLISSRYYFYNLVQEVIYFDPKILGSFLVLVSVSVIDCCQNFVTLRYTQCHISVIIVYHFYGFMFYIAQFLDKCCSE